MDHFALPMLAGKNPLVGPNDDELGPRFPPSSNTYDPANQDLVVKAASNLGFRDFIRKDGLYCFVSGPMYESRSECKFLSSIGGSAVGMSTVPEIIAAHASGMKVLCLSLITNKVIITGDEDPPPVTRRSLRKSRRGPSKFRRWFRKLSRFSVSREHWTSCQICQRSTLTSRPRKAAWVLLFVRITWSRESSMHRCTVC